MGGWADSKAFHRLRTARPSGLIAWSLRTARRRAGARRPPRGLLEHVPSWGHLASLEGTPIMADGSDPVVAAADRFLVGGISLLGRNMQPWSIGWRTDPRTGYEWTGHTRDGGDVPTGTDVKAPWELSRFYFAPWLAAASSSTGDRRYVDALCDLTTDWVEANPFGDGVNWDTPMEAAIRGANLAIALATIAAGRDELDDESPEVARSTLAPLIACHGWWVGRNLERGPGPPANHLLVDLAGLAVCGWAMAETDDGRRWLDRARSGLERQCRAQFDLAGAHVEQAPYYHRLCAESLAAAGAAIGAAGGESEIIRGAVERTRRVVAAYTRPDGSAPELADSDDGRFTVPSGMFDHERDHHDHLFWLSPGEDPPAPPPPIATFASAGYVFLRQERADGRQSWASLRCGTFAPYGGHVHSDQLHVTWSVDIANVLLDPGTGTYGGDPALRNRLRSARSHNAPVVDGEDPNGPISDDIFWMADRTRAALMSIRGDNKGPVTASGSHSGYYRRKIGVTRTVELRPDLCITDRIDGNGEHSVEWGFCVSGEWSLDGVGAEGVVAGSPFRAEFSLADGTRDGLSTRLEERTRSPAYGVEEEAAWLVLRWSGQLPVEVEIAFICPDAP